MSTFEIQHFKNQELAKAYMQGVRDITEWLLKPSERTATNFDKITASPEALAKFINEIIEYMYHGETGTEACPFWRLCTDDELGCEECIARWLKQEAEEEE